MPEKNARSVGTNPTSTFASRHPQVLPTSEIIGYATEGTLLISVHLSTDAASVLRIERMEAAQRRGTHVNRRASAQGKKIKNKIKNQSRFNRAKAMWAVIKNKCKKSLILSDRAQELCGSRGGLPGLPGPKSQN